MTKSAQKEKQTKTVCGKDEFGKQILLKDGDLQVMMEWEKPYLEACIDALKPSGNILEIGFGLGYSSAQIQKYHPKSHTIIEADPDVAENAKKWAKQHPNVKIIQGNWQTELGKLGVFDAIFFDDYFPLSGNEISQLKDNLKQCQQIAQKAKSLKDDLEEALEQFSEIKFTDNDLRTFTEQILAKPNVEYQNVVDFLESLAKHGNISAQQKSHFLKDLDKRHKAMGKDKQKQPSNWVNAKRFPGERLIPFIEECLKKHMHAGSRLSAYAGTPESKRQHTEFQEKIQSRKDINYSEKTIPVNVPSNCTYYQGDKALIMIIEKK